MADKNNILDRYTAGARLNHWINAILMICLVLSGMALFHPSLFFLTDLFGGGTMARIVHPWIGVLAMLSFLGLFIRFWRFNLWTRDDSAWMRNVKHVVSGDEAKVPEAGKYNAGQKLVFWLMSILTILLLTSGARHVGLAVRRVHHDRSEAPGGGRARRRGGGAVDRGDHPHLRRDLDPRHDPRHDARLGHRRLGVAPSPQVAA